MRSAQIMRAAGQLPGSGPVVICSDFVTILQLRVLGLITCKYHESPNENCESQNFGSRELLYCIVFVLFTVYVYIFIIIMN